jgi:O-antigen/teichoic acid export membrane protein
MLMLGVVQELMNQIDIILLGQLADQRQAALFAASWRLASLVPFALVGLGTMGGPLIAAAYERGDLDELQRISRIVSRAGFVFALVSALLIFAAARPLLGLFGREFVAGRDVLPILLLGGIVNAFTGIVAYFLTLTGRERHGLAIFAAALALSILLNLVLIPRFGAVGAAIASSSATIAWNFAMLIYVRRAIGLDASALALPSRINVAKG